ncbi:MAG: kinase [Bacteroidales bacterium]|jgi:hypothetical protein|nr:kinase [Bacteroidales bacterium]
MLEYYQNRLCVRGGWLYDDNGVMSFSNYKALTTRKQLLVLRKGCRNTPALVDFESMPTRFKIAIEERVGNVYEAAKENQLLKLLVPDQKAQDFYKTHRFGENNERSLPEDAQLEYYNNAIVMNAASAFFTDRRSRRKAIGNGNVTKLWEEISGFVNRLDREKYPHSLPGSSARLRQKQKQYTKNGYIEFVHGNYCNKNTEKLSAKAKYWILARWMNNIERVTSVEHLLNVYNNHASEMRLTKPDQVKEWKEIKSVNTLHRYLHSSGIEELWRAERYGELKTKERHLYQHTTLLPTMRDSLWYSDGTKLNLYYRDSEGKIATTSVYEVMDVYSEVFLGYSIGKNENYEMQHKAYKMALKFSEHKPYEIRFDGQGGHKKLQSNDFLSKLSRVAIRTQPHNGKSKTIESAFGRFQQQILKQEVFFTGQNITATADESRANNEFILANKHMLPTLEEAIAIYEKRRNEWNNAVHPKAKSGETRMEMYMQSCNENTTKISLMDMVDLFCISREHKVRVTAYGMQFKENKEKYNYMVYNGDMPDIDWVAA